MLQVRNPRHREVRQIAQGHTARKYQTHWLQNLCLNYTLDCLSQSDVPQRSYLVIINVFLVVCVVF